MKNYRHVVLLITWLFSASVMTGSGSFTEQEVQSILDSALVNRKDNPDKTIAYTDSLIKTLDDNNPQKALALRYRGMAMKYKLQYTDAIADYQKSLEIERKNDSSVGQIAALNSIGNIHKVQREYDKAVVFYIKSLKVSESLYPKPQEISDTHNSMGSIFSKLKRFEEANKHFNEALSIQKAAFDALSDPKEDEKLTERLAATYQDIGGMYLRMDSLNTALGYYKKSIKLNKAIDNQRALGKIYDGIGSTYFKKNKYEKAIEYYEKSFETKEKLSAQRGMAVTATNLCELLSEQKKHKQAMPYCNKSIEYGKEQKDYRILENTMFVLYKAAKMKGDSKEALKYYEYYVAYRDSLSNNKKDIEIQKIISQHKIEKEKAQAEKQKVIEQQKIQRQKSLLTTGMFSALIMALGLFFYSRSKQKLHQEEQKRRIQEEQLRIQEEQLHKETEGRRIEEQKLYNQVIKTLEKEAEIQAVNAEIDAKLQERTKVASALHDSVCSGLVSARMHFESYLPEASTCSMKPTKYAAKFPTTYRRPCWQNSV